MFGQGLIFAFWVPKFVLGSALNASHPLSDQLLLTKVNRNKLKTEIFKQLCLLLAAYQPYPDSLGSQKATQRLPGSRV